MTKLGWVGDGNWELTDNKSNIFERFPTVKVKTITFLLKYGRMYIWYMEFTW